MEILNAAALPSSRSRRGGREGFSPLHWPEQGEGQRSKGFSGFFESGTDTFCPGNPQCSFPPGQGLQPTKVEFPDPLLQIGVSQVEAGPWRDLGRAEGFKERLRIIKLPLKSSVGNHQQFVLIKLQK